MFFCLLVLFFKCLLRTTLSLQEGCVDQFGGHTFVSLHFIRQQKLMIPNQNLTVYMCKLAGAVGICGLMQSFVKWTRASHGNGSSKTV